MENLNHQQPLIFSHVAAQGKPQHMSAEKNGCPFCDYKDKENIVTETDDFMWVLNKYATLENTLQTIIIETRDHDADMTNYSRQYNRELMRFSINCWQQVKNDPKYRSVLFYKNHGPQSGGSLQHAHMQVVGLEELDGEENLISENFEGIEVLTKNQLLINFSTEPVMGFLEINVSVPAKVDAELNVLADAVQDTVQFILNEYYRGRCDSFNLFFYERAERLIAKITPRFVTSPYFVGYKLSQTFTNKHLYGIRDEFRDYLRTKH
ncbi:DUF4931 domain-containing protein [Candidatus Enterococcus ferrettii]|uniref:Galactose-1-phosphate uridylyltransferase n=1 Tax=Candidatus Enterococcus ferrettii TaxID=2815324 RepID=A0ABV0ET72_9ENTE|nr:DUF4931 domain-containing protein [Enterococcus sp. 665A]MBO1340203.1 DUF4931 domain-containing protein [Enterococcus sp. 665A]